MFAWRDEATEKLASYNIRTFIPGEDTTLNDGDTITKLDYMEIDNSEAILVNLDFLDGRTIASGTLIEIGYARARGKLIVGYTTTKWLKEHRFLRSSVDKVFNSLDEAIEYLGGFNFRRRIV